MKLGMYTQLDPESNLINVKTPSVGGGGGGGGFLRLQDPKNWIYFTYLGKVTSCMSNQKVVILTTHVIGSHKVVITYVNFKGHYIHSSVLLRTGHFNNANFFHLFYSVHSYIHTKNHNQVSSKFISHHQSVEDWMDSNQLSLFMTPTCHHHSTVLIGNLDTTQTWLLCYSNITDLHQKMVNDPIQASQHRPIAILQP